MACLVEMYSLLYPSSSLELCRFYVEGKQVTINGEHFISSKSRSKRSAGIIAHWATSTGINQDNESDVTFTPGVVSSFIQHKVTVRTPSNENMTRVHILCRVQWLQQHPCKDTYIPSLIISSVLFDPPNCANFMPICRIAGRCAIAKTIASFDYGEDNVCVCVPLLKQVLV